MAHVVISQTWLKDGDEHVQAYLALAAEYDSFLRAQPGFVSRQLVHSLEDPRHIVHLRVFEKVADYEAMTRVPEYQDQIAALSEHVDPQAYPAGAVPRTYGEIVFESAPSER